MFLFFVCGKHFNFDTNFQFFQNTETQQKTTEYRNLQQYNIRKEHCKTSVEQCKEQCKTTLMFLSSTSTIKLYRRKKLRSFIGESAFNSHMCLYCILSFCN